jgi:hypothetical protein
MSGNNQLITEEPASLPSRITLLGHAQAEAFRNYYRLYFNLKMENIVIFFIFAQIVNKRDVFRHLFQFC